MQVGGANILRAVYVLAQSSEHIHIVAPYRNVLYVIAVASGYLIGLPTSVKCPQIVEEVFQILGSACFQQGFRPAVGQYRGNKDCRGYAVKIILKSIPAECIRNLELWIYRRIGCISVGFVIIAYCHWRAERKGINISAECSLNGNNRLFSLCVPPILPDFYNIGHCLATFLHFHRKEKHS